MKKIKNVLKIIVIVTIILVFVVSYIDFGFRSQPFQQAPAEDAVEKNQKQSPPETVQSQTKEFNLNTQNQPPKNPYQDFWGATSTLLKS